MTGSVSAAPLLVRAPAKVNLFLEILARRPDGYHDLATLLLRVGLADTLAFTPVADGSLTLYCDTPGLSVGSDNLVLKAAQALRTATGCPAGASIRLTKRIPMQAGLAGGSADAGVTLAALNRLWGLGLPVSALAAVAATVGSDVAFFVHDVSAAWCTGRGDVVQPVAVGRPLDLVLICPAAGLATAAVYGRVSVPAEPQDGEAVRAALAAGDLPRLGAELFNRLEAPAVALEPAVAAWAGRLTASDALGWRMSGSGSSLFALCRDRRHAAGLVRRLRAVAADEGMSAARFYVVRSC
ncbi:MAG: 4-(cytidine 5'-diphospho)-2-C-methyl-D-erythritol kinase [Gemmataceae bacterium]